MNKGKNSSASDRARASYSIPEQCIRERAYEIYRQRGSKGGHAESDWLTAEAELRELKKKAADLLSAVESPSGSR
jgi:hypothetical protein